MYSTMTGAASYSMVPRSMLGKVKAAPYRQWVQLERYAGKRDYVDLSAVDLGQIWNGISRQKALKAAYGLAQWVVMEKTGTRGVTRYWPSPVDLSDPERHADVFARMIASVEKRADGARFADDRTKSYREWVMTRKGTAHSYIRVPVAILGQAGSDTDFLVWSAMRSFLGPGGIYAAHSTIGEIAGVPRETVARATGRLVKAGLMEDTGRKTSAGTKVYNVPQHLAGKDLPGSMEAAA